MKIGFSLVLIRVHLTCHVNVALPVLLNVHLLHEETSRIVDCSRTKSCLWVSLPRLPSGNDYFVIFGARRRKDNWRKRRIVPTATKIKSLFMRLSSYLCFRKIKQFLVTQVKIIWEPYLSSMWVCGKISSKITKTERTKLLSRAI